MVCVKMTSCTSYIIYDKHQHIKYPVPQPFCVSICKGEKGEIQKDGAAQLHQQHFYIIFHPGITQSHLHMFPLLISYCDDYGVKSQINLCSISALCDSFPFISWLSSKSLYICLFLGCEAVELLSPQFKVRRIVYVCVCECLKAITLQSLYRCWQTYWFSRDGICIALWQYWETEQK